MEDFAFAFNSKTFSDRLIQIVVTEVGKVDSSNTDDSEKLHKRRRPNVDNVKELHINSAILAAKSSFFYKLFSNGMLESEKRIVTLEIDVSEEVAVMDLLKFMYTNTLSVTTAPDLLNVLIAADKYEVPSCMNHCSGLLLDLPMTVDFALRILDLPESMLIAESVQPLMNAARQFITSHYKELYKFPVEEVMALPLVAIETILASNDLEILSEDTLYDFVLKWVKTHYSELQERQEILGSRLAPFIRFPQMTSTKLAEIATSGDFSPIQTSNIVLKALVYKAESMNRQRILTPQQEPLPSNTWSVERVYEYKPIQLVEFEAPRHQCIVYLDLTRKECEGLYPSNRLYSQIFQVRGKGFRLYAQCKLEPSNRFHCFGLFLTLEDRERPVSVNVDYKFSVRSKPNEEFVNVTRGRYTFTGGLDVGNDNLCGLPWELFMSLNSLHFINDVLHLRAELSILH